MCFVLLLISTNLASQSISESFELRYFTDDSKANGETDFHGETEYFDTDQRIAFLHEYGQYASRFFDDPDLDTKVITEKEAEELVNRLKKQPLPAVRNRIIPGTWKWIGYSAENKHRKLADLNKWKTVDGVEVTGQSLLFQSSGVSFQKVIPDQIWRFSLQFDVMVPSPNSRFSLALVDGNRSIASVGIDDGNRFFYTTGGEMIKQGTCGIDQWHTFKLEIDLVNNRYNLYIDKKLYADFTELDTGITSIGSLLISANEGVGLDNLYGVSFRPTETKGIPYMFHIFLDEDVMTPPSIQGWNGQNYDDSRWEETTLPKVHGGNRYAGEDLYLRQQISVGDFEQAVLNFETLDPGGEIWINGRVAAVINNRYPVKLDVSEYLRPNSENLIAVRVNSSVAEVPLAHSGGGDPNTGWFAGRMHLDLIERTYINEVLVHAEEVGETASMRHRIVVENKTMTSFNGLVQVRYYPWFPMESPEIAAEAEFPFQINPSSRIEIDKLVYVKNPLLWTCDNPSLYKVEVLLKDASGKELDDYILTTGIRTISQEGGVFQINGEPAMLNGAQTFGCHMPPDRTAMWTRCPPAKELLKEVMMIKRMNGNMMRVHVHTERFKPDGINDPRLPEICDQLGMMLIWQTPAWIRNGEYWNVDFEGYPKYIRQLFNSPSIVMWEVANHPWPRGTTYDSTETVRIFKNNSELVIYGLPDHMWPIGRRTYTVDETNRIFTKVHNAIYPLDPSRLISPTSQNRVFVVNNDAGTLDIFGNQIETVDAFRAPMITRGNQDSFTGYGKKWSVLRKFPDPFVTSLLNSQERAYFNFEHEESAAQPNWSLVKGKPWYNLHSYEWYYDEGSIGRKLQLNEWMESQAWQAFSAWESMKKQRLLGYDGFSWCCLHGGANMGTYKKPLIDCLGHAKLAFYTNGMIFQQVVAGSNNVDVVYGPNDSIGPVIMNLGDARSVNLTVQIKGVSGEAVDTKEYGNIELPKGRTITELDAFIPEVEIDGLYVVEYTISEINK